MNKHKLDEVRATYDAEFYYHIGDTDLDKHFATLHGFEFLQVQTMDPHPWMLDEAGQVLWGPQGRGPLEVPAAPRGQTCCHKPGNTTPQRANKAHQRVAPPARGRVRGTAATWNEGGRY